MNGIVYKGLITKERLWNYYHHGNEKATPLKTTVTVNGGLVVPGQCTIEFTFVLCCSFYSFYFRYICIL